MSFPAPTLGRNFEPPVNNNYNEQHHPMAGFKGVKFLTDSDGPLREIYVNPEYVATVEQDMAKPDQISHITLVTGHDYRVSEPAAKVNQRLQYAI